MTLQSEISNVIINIVEFYRMDDPLEINFMEHVH